MIKFYDNEKFTVRLEAFVFREFYSVVAGIKKIVNVTVVGCVVDG